MTREEKVLMEKFTETSLVSLTPAEMVHMAELIERDAVHDGIPTEDDDINICPHCGRMFADNDAFCSLCGTRLKFVISDVIPL